MWIIPAGYTLAFWVNFMQPCGQQFVYMSNGGHDRSSHGVAMLYGQGSLEFRFLRKNGAEWQVTSDDVLPGQWYHITVSWSMQNGLALYINGDLADNDISPNMRTRAGVTTRYNDFVLGRPNDNTPVNSQCIMAIDGFDFWSKQKGPNEVQQQGECQIRNAPSFSPLFSIWTLHDLQAIRKLFHFSKLNPDINLHTNHFGWLRERSCIISLPKSNTVVLGWHLQKYDSHKH